MDTETQPPKPRYKGPKPPRKPRGPRVDRRSAKVHTGILEAASELVAELGYNKVSIEAIAAKAGSGKQTIYRWWPTKAHLFLELYVTLAPEMLLSVDTGTAKSDLRMLLIRLFEVYEGSPAGPILAGLISESQRNAEVADAVRKRLVVDRRSLIGSILGRGIARGEFRPDLDLNLAIDVISGVIWLRLLVGHSPLDRTFADALVNLISDGIARR